MIVDVFISKNYSDKGTEYLFFPFCPRYYLKNLFLKFWSTKCTTIFVSIRTRYIRAKKDFITYDSEYCHIKRDATA